MKIVKYRTARECLAAYHGCGPSEIPLPGVWIYYDRKGNQRRHRYKECYESILKRGCWAWCENKSTLHLWISRRAKFADAIGLIAHEVGHCQKPYLRFGREETKAARYEYVAQEAAKIFKLFY